MHAFNTRRAEAGGFFWVWGSRPVWSSKWDHDGDMVTQRNPVMGGKNEANQKQKNPAGKHELCSTGSEWCHQAHAYWVTSSFLPSHGFISCGFTPHGLRACVLKRLCSHCLLRDTRACTHTAEVCSQLYYGDRVRKNVHPVMKWLQNTFSAHSPSLSEAIVLRERNELWQVVNHKQVSWIFVVLNRIRLCIG